MNLLRKLTLIVVASSFVVACGDDGQDGATGPAGPAGPAGPTGAAGPVGPTGSTGADGGDGQDGTSSLVRQTPVGALNEACFQGGIQVDSGVDDNDDGVLSDAEVDNTSFICAPTQLNDAQNFVRIATFPVCAILDPTCDTDTETAAEIVDVSSDGNTLIFSDSPREAIGFVDISDPASPEAMGSLDLGGEPTSVAVAGDYVLVGINTSPDFDNPSGELAVIEVATSSVVRVIDLGGQPDAVAVSPDGSYAAIAIENERDEGENDGQLPQLPAGFLVSVDISDADPANWVASEIAMVGLADFAPTDPEPEYVDINANNVAVVTLQENNHIVLVDLTNGMVINDFAAGSVDLVQIDATAEDPAQIIQNESQSDVPREPDGVAWINGQYFATADEGDLDGGSRGFTVYDINGNIAFSSGNTLDLLAAKVGHYPDGRSGNKGNEPENAEVGVFGADRYLFVNSERSSIVFVYDVADPTRPVLKQILPAGVAPEGVKAIPGRNLVVVASEEDSRGDKIRSSLSLYRYGFDDSAYPTVESVSRTDGTPIPWSAMSGLAADPNDASRLYAIEDSFFGANRIFEIRVDRRPARLTREIRISDANDVLKTIPTSTAASDPAAFDDVDRAALVNADDTVNLDPEGIAVASDGGFWIASEGAGTVTSTDTRPINSLNFIVKTDAAGVIEDVITLPESVNDLQVRFGFEGISEFNGRAYVAFQREWGGEAEVRIGVYDVTSETWAFFFYPLDAAESQFDSWVGLSDITSLNDGRFLVVERDNQGGPDAAVKRLYTFDTAGLLGGETVTKVLVRDLLLSGDLAGPGGLIPEKIEGTAVTADGDVYIINDNDGVDDNSGETQLLNLGAIIP